MKKVIFRVLACVLILSLHSWSFGVNALAKENTGIVCEEVMVFDDVTIILQEGCDGTITVSEYKKGILTQKNLITRDTDGVIVRDFYDGEGKCAVHRDEMHISDIGEFSRQNAMSSRVDTSYALYGHIEYRVTVTEGSVYYMQAVRLDTSGPVTTTYTIRNWVGTVVDLISIFLSAGIGSISAINGFVPGLLVSLGITVSGGAITSALSTTVASSQITYTWQIYDVYVQIPTYISGTRNYIVDETSHYGKTYYDGVVPSHWGTTSMSVLFYNSSYFESAWTVSRWIMDPNNGYM